jgi:hypothetical protein
MQYVCYEHEDSYNISSEPIRNLFNLIYLSQSDSNIYSPKRFALSTFHIPNFISLLRLLRHRSSKNLS